MLRGISSAIVCLGLPTVLPADFSYQQTSKITGGAMAGAMKFAGAFSKQMREPMQATVLVKGDRMAHLSQNHASIIDLSNETITDIDFQKKTYSIMTFAQMKQMMDEMTQKMKEKGSDSPQMQFKFSANSTGQTKTISGYEAKEMVMKVVMEGTDEKTGHKGGMTMTTSTWIAAVPGSEEARNFYKRMAEKMAWTPGSNPMMMRDPKMAQGMAEVAKELAKLDGLPVLQVMKTGVEGAPEGSASSQSAPPPQPEKQAEKQAEKPSVGSVLGGRFGGLGGLGRKKPKKEEAKAEEAPAEAASTPAAAPADASGALMEMTIESSGFSTASVDGSKFEVPAGFKKIDSMAEHKGR